MTAREHITKYLRLAKQGLRNHVDEAPGITTQNAGEDNHLLVKGPGGFEYVGPESQVGLALKTLVKLQIFRAITRVIIAIIWAILTIILRHEIIGLLG